MKELQGREEERKEGSNEEKKKEGSHVEGRNESKEGKKEYK